MVRSRPPRSSHTRGAIGSSRGTFTSRARYRLAVGVLLLALRAAAVLGRLVEQLDLALEQLQLELDTPLQRRLADVALVQAALDDHAGRRQRADALERDPLHELLGDGARRVEQPGLLQLVVD